MRNSGSYCPVAPCCPRCQSTFPQTDTSRRQRTLTPEIQSVEDERAKARRPFDEVIELGGIPLRPWTDYRAEELTEAQLSDDNGEKHIMCLYMDDYQYWQAHLGLWRRFAKRRTLDGEPDLRDLEPVDAMAAFTAYMRGHLQRDMQDRAKPGCEIWSFYASMTAHRHMIEDIVALLPPAEALLRQLREDKGVDDALTDFEVTSEGLRKEYNIPPSRLWMNLWFDTQDSLSAAELESSHPSKRPIDEVDEEGEEDARTSKRAASDSKPSAETICPIPLKKRKGQTPTALEDNEPEERSYSRDPEAPQSANGNTTRDNPVPGKGRGNAPEGKINSEE